MRRNRSIDPDRYVHLGERELERIYRVYVAAESLESARGGGFGGTLGGAGVSRSREPLPSAAPDKHLLATNLASMLGGSLLTLTPGVRVDPEMFDLKYLLLETSEVRAHYLPSKDGHAVNIMAYLADVLATLGERQLPGMLAMFGSYQHATRWSTRAKPSATYYPSRLAGLAHALDLRRGYSGQSPQPVEFAGAAKIRIATEVAQLVDKFDESDSVLTFPASVYCKVHGVFTQNDVARYGDLKRGYDRRFDYAFCILATPLVIEARTSVDLIP